jgi:hypothetical protein
LLVIYLMDSSKMRISAKEVERMLGISYETAWNMHRRIGQAMEKPEQKGFLQKLIRVIGAPESKVAAMASYKDAPAVFLMMHRQRTGRVSSSDPRGVGIEAINALGTTAGIEVGCGRGLS